MTTELRDQLQHTLGKAYTLERELRGGGMSRVFVANDTALGRRIVVKILAPELAAGVSMERFRREIQFAAGLLHPHIVPLLGAGEADGLPYYTMPFIEGETLRTRLVREWRLGVDSALQLAREVATALDYAHRQGVVHRDIKPENILLHDGHALVADFGIARAVAFATASGDARGSRGESLTEFGIAIGTPAYMSPEQAAGDRDLDGRSDIYALGCVLYEMLVGEPPFKGSSGRAILARHSAEPPKPPSALRPELSGELDALLLRTLAKDPHNRFESASQLSAALRSASAGGSGAVAVQTPRAPEADRIVAVLPFHNMSPDPDNEYFSDGITEEIIAQLSKIRGLRVISRTSVMLYKNSGKTVREIARELGASRVLSGSVRRAGSRVRISAELIIAASEEHCWTETYDTDMADIFAVQSRVAEQIAERMQTRVTTGERTRIERTPTRDIEAYNLFLLGRHHYAKVTGEDFAKAISCYEAAIERDPSFARAHAAIAEALAYSGLGYWGARPHDTTPAAFKHATRAIELDPTIAEAHEIVGLYHEWYKFDYKRGGDALARAVELNPSAPFPRLVYGMHLAAFGRFDDAILQRDMACLLDPSAMVIRGNASWIMYLSRRMEEAVADARQIRQIDPSSSYGAFSHGLVCAQAGHPDEAIAAFEDAVRLSNRASLHLIMLAYGFAVAGKHIDARRILDEILQRATTEFVWPMGVAFAYAHLGESDRALDWLETAYRERVGWMALIGREPALDVLRPHPRFQSIARKILPVELQP